jgi:ribosomal protein S18 acetylase RimI-like enzyme
LTAVAFRPASAGDLAAIAALTERAYAPWQALLGYPPLPMTEDYRPRVAGGEVVLAVESGPAVENALALGLIVVERTKGHDMIFSVAVEPARAGKGIGKALIAEAERRARIAGQSEMRLYTNALMLKNIAFYQGLGYRETGRRPNGARPGFFIVDMAKTL